MDQQFLDLRQAVFDASGGFIEAQQAYSSAATAQQSDEVLQRAAENCLLAAKPYEEALREFQQYLLSVEPSDEIAIEIGHVEQFLITLDKETRAISVLANQHAKASHGGVS